MKIPFFLTIFLCVICSAVSTNVDATNQINVVAEDFKPFQYQENGQTKGVVVDIVNTILQQHNLTADVHFYPWARALKIANTQPNTMILSISRTKQRENNFHWIGKIKTHELFLWVNASKWPENMLTTNDLKSLTIGVPRNGHQHEFLSTHPLFKHSNLSIVTNKPQSIKMLSLNRIDAILGDKALLKYRIKQLGLDPDFIKPVEQFSIPGSELYIALSKNSDPKLVETLTSSFEHFSLTPEFKMMISNLAKSIN